MHAGPARLIVCLSLWHITAPDTLLTVNVGGVSRTCLFMLQPQGDRETNTHSHTHTIRVESICDEESLTSNQGTPLVHLHSVLAYARVCG